MNAYLIAPEHHEDRTRVREPHPEDREFYVRMNDVEPIFNEKGDFAGWRVLMDGFSKTWFDENAGRVPQPSGDAEGGPVVWREVEQFVKFYDEARIYRLELVLPYPEDGSGSWRWYGPWPEYGPWIDPRYWSEWDESPEWFLEGFYLYSNGRDWEGGRWYPEPGGGNWHLVETAPGFGSPMAGAPGEEKEPPSEGGVYVTIHANLFQAGPRYEVKRMEPVLDDGRRTQLNAATNTNHLSDADDAYVASLLTDVSQKGVDFAVVYDVGQGGCQGLCDANGAVRAYFDFGGGVTVNGGTFPPNLKHFCFAHNPPIILSHWDEDHWSSSGHDPRALQADWLAPKQRMSTGANAHVAAIAQNGGTLRYFTSALTLTWHGQVYLELAQGPAHSKNNTGIALTLSQYAAGGGHQFLMPADAEYRFITSANATPGARWTAKNYHSVVAPHHGGRLASSYPVPAGPVTPALSRDQRLAYSYGWGNNHGHPLPNTETLHISANWQHLLPRPPTGKGMSRPTPTPAMLSSLDVRETAHRTGSGFGHILLGWPGTNLQNLHYHQCTPQQCDLEPQQ